MGSRTLRVNVNDHRISPTLCGKRPTLRLPAVMPSIAMLPNFLWGSSSRGLYHLISAFQRLHSMLVSLGTAVTAVRPITSYCIPVMSKEEGFYLQEMHA